MTDTADYGPNRSAPHAIEAEEAVLGCVLINPDAYFEVSAFLKPDDFYLHKHRWIWDAFVGLHEQRLPIDIITVSEELERHTQLAEVGGTAQARRKQHERALDRVMAELGLDGPGEGGGEE